MRGREVRWFEHPTLVGIVDVDPTIRAQLADPRARRETDRHRPVSPMNDRMMRIFEVGQKGSSRRVRHDEETTTCWVLCVWHLVAIKCSMASEGPRPTHRHVLKRRRGAGLERILVENPLTGPRTDRFQVEPFAGLPDPISSDAETSFNLAHLYSHNGCRRRRMPWIRTTNHADINASFHGGGIAFEYFPVLLLVL